MPAPLPKTQLHSPLYPLAALYIIFTAIPGCNQHKTPVRPTYRPPQQAFEGNSSGLNRTIIAATLDEALSKGKNVIWCASFELAWKKLKSDIIQQPIELNYSSPLVDRLNAATLSEAAMPPGDFYVNAGFVDEGISETIQKDMQERFRHEVKFNATQEAAVVIYAFLQSHVKFSTPFAECDPIDFRGSDARIVSVSSFGLGGEMKDFQKEGEQVDVLYANSGTIDEPGNVQNTQPEFVLDLCKTSKPNQIIVACIPPKATLAETLNYVQHAIGQTPDDDPLRSLWPYDEVRIPNMKFTIAHTFSEVMNARLLNAGRDAFIGTVRQDLRFRLDRSGAHVQSEAEIAVTAGARYFHFNRPFLLYIKSRASNEPFFVMWVDNAELLSRP